MVENRKCETCDFFQEQPSNSGTADGICRKNPPTAFCHLVADNLGGPMPIFVTCYPSMKKKDWCGEYKEKALKLSME